MSINLPEQFSFSSGLLEEIEDKSQIIKPLAGENLLKTGQIIRHFPIVLEGLLRVFRVGEDGKEIFLYFLKKGDTCAMALTCCMTGVQSEVSVQTEEDSQILLISVDNMDHWMQTYPEWKRYVMSMYRQKFQGLLEVIDEIAFKKMDERLIDYLKTKTDATSSLLVKETHQHIAQQLGSSREVISRLLKKMEREGLVVLSRNTIECHFDS